MAPLAREMQVLWWRHAWPGFLGTLSGVGLGRFAYTSLMPFLIASGALTAAAAAYLGAANLMGYFVGAALAARLAQAVGMTRALRAAFVLTTLSFVACIPEWGFWWYFPWRVLIGVTGGLLMVLGAGFLYAGSPPEGRGRIGGVVFAGVGGGIALAGLVVTPLAALDPAWAWAVMALGAGVASVATWPRWRGGGTIPLPRRRGGQRLGAAASLAILGFAMDGIGYTAHALFWVDFIARYLGRGASAGALAWTLFGIGATLGPMVAGAMGDTIGLGRALALGLLVKSLGVALPVLSTAPLALAVSSLVVGALSPAFPALTSARLAELVPPSELTRVWGLATLAFAALQAVAGYAMSYAFAEFGSYVPLFMAGSLALLIGAGAALLSLILAPRAAIDEI
ncbi:MAG TPA: YbfB/YjiJ family MFS transporter [Stellaceae bacterium]|nr:YbfB/YjiJ family MFS transporter [Stellaceae bacterium]